MVFELRGEYDMFWLMSAFGAARYVRGDDCEISQPLPQIAPLEGTVGLRWEDLEASRPWGFDTGLRIVDAQDRIAYLRDRVPGPGGVVPLEEQTGGFMTAYMRGYVNMTQNMHVIGGIDNLFDRNYIEHLNLRLPQTTTLAAAPVLSPGITPYIGVEWVY